MSRRLSAWAWFMALTLHLALAFGLAFWTGLLPGLLLALPMAAALPGLYRKSTYTAGWTTMLLVFYCAGLMAEAFAIPARRHVALILSVVAALEFVSLVLFVRLTARERPPT